MSLLDVALFVIALLCKSSFSLDLTCGDSLCVREKLNASDVQNEDMTYHIRRNPLGHVKMRWLPDNISIEVQTQEGPSKILLQPAVSKKEIGPERIPCLFVGTLDIRPDHTHLTVSGCRDHPKETIVTVDNKAFVFKPDDRPSVASPVATLSWRLRNQTNESDYRELEIDAKLTKVFAEASLADSGSDQDRHSGNSVSEDVVISAEDRFAAIEQRLELLEAKSIHVVYKNRWSGSCNYPPRNDWGGTCPENTIIDHYNSLVEIGRSQMNKRDGVWTAGLDGFYAVSWSMKLDRQGAHKVFLKKNNSRLAETVLDMSHPPPTMANNVQFQDDMSSRSIVLNLKKGDKLALEVAVQHGDISNIILSVHLI